MTPDHPFTANSISASTTAATAIAATDTLDSAPDPNLSNPIGGTLAVILSLGFAMGCGLWRKRQKYRHALRRLQIVATLEALWRKDVK